MIFERVTSPARARAREESQLSLDDAILGVGVIPDESRAVIMQKLQVLAADMLEHAQEHGVGFDEVREAAERRGILTGAEMDRFLSFGSGLMKGAGGIVVRSRKSRMKSAQRRRIQVYVHRKYLPERTEAQWPESPSTKPGKGSASHQRRRNAKRK